MLTMWLLLVKKLEEPNGEERHGEHGAEVDEQVELGDIGLLISLLRTYH